MDIISKEVFDLLIWIVPGLFGYAIYSLLYAPPKSAPLERVIQALLFTVVIRGLVGIVKWLCFEIGEWYPLCGRWSTVSENIALIICTVFIALLFLKIMQTDKVFKVLRNLNLTNKTPFPSEWYGTFFENDEKYKDTGYVTLHMRDERFIFGNPIQWPSTPDEGHFMMIDAEWVTKDEEEKPRIKSILIPVSEVKFVEFTNELGGTE